MEMSHNDVFTLPDTKTGTETDKNCLYRIVWCSYCTGTNTDSAVPHFICISFGLGLYLCPQNISWRSINFVRIHTEQCQRKQWIPFLSYNAFLWTGFKAHLYDAVAICVNVKTEPNLRIGSYIWTNKSCIPVGTRTPAHFKVYRIWFGSLSGVVLLLTETPCDKRPPNFHVTWWWHAGLLQIQHSWNIWVGALEEFWTQILPAKFW